MRRITQNILLIDKIAVTYTKLITTTHTITLN